MSVEVLPKMRDVRAAAATKAAATEGEEAARPTPMEA